MGKGKRIRPSQPPKQGGVVGLDPRVPPPGGTDDQRPIFDLQHLSGPYCLTACDQAQQAAFVLTLHRLSRMTWGEIQRSPRHGLGAEKIAVSSLRASLPTSFTPDVTFVLAIRFNGKAPMLGHRSGPVFTILLLDRDFSAYDHG